MKIVLPSLVISAFLLVGMSCTTSKKTENKPSKEWTYSIMETGNMFGAGEEGLNEGVLSAKNMEEFNAVVQQINSINKEITDDLVATTDFFKESMLLFIFDKVRGSGGHTMEVINITHTSEALVVSIKNTAPEGPASTVMTQPFVVLKTAKSSLPIQVKVIGL